VKLKSHSTKTPNALLISWMCATCSAHLISSHLATCYSKYENITQYPMVDTGFGKTWKPFKKL